MKNLPTVLTLAGMVGVLVLFVPFAYSTVPLTDVLLGSASFEPLSSLWLLALPVVILPVPISLSLALSLTGRLPAWANPAGSVLAAASACGTLLALVLDADGGSTPLALGLFGLAYAGGAWFSIRAVRDSCPAVGAVAMQAAYLVPTTAFLAAFLFDNADIGAYLAFLTVVVYGAQMALAVKRRLSFLAVLLPLTVLVVSGVLAD